MLPVAGGNVPMDEKVTSPPRNWMNVLHLSVQGLHENTFCSVTDVMWYFYDNFLMRLLLGNTVSFVHPH